VANPTLKVLSAPNSAGTGSPEKGVFRRDFERGIVVVNTTAVPVTIPLERSFKKLKGHQDPATNDGSEVDSVTVGPRDATILLR
jgi:hypothetical protein